MKEQYVRNSTIGISQAVAILVTVLMVRWRMCPRDRPVESYIYYKITEIFTIMRFGLNSIIEWV